MTVGSLFLFLLRLRIVWRLFGDIRASTHVWASLWISIIAGLHMVIVFLVVHISGLYKNVLPAGSTATYLFSRFKVAYILFVVLCASGIDFI